MNLEGRISKHLETFSPQPRGAPFIMLLLVWQGVNIAINLNDEVAGENDKVGHIWPDWRLAPNVDTVGLQLS